jgi:hypothetical protein
MTIEQALLAYSEAINTHIFANPDFNRKDKGNEGANASGNFASFIMRSPDRQTIEVTPQQTKFTKYGTPYTDAIDKGTPPSTRSGLEKDLYEWLVYEKYGLRWNTENQRKSLAKYLSNKIQKFGTFKYRNPTKQTAIIADALEASKPTLFDLLNRANIEEVQAKINQSLK